MVLGWGPGLVTTQEGQVASQVRSHLVAGHQSYWRQLYRGEDSGGRSAGLVPAGEYQVWANWLVWLAYGLLLKEAEINQDLQTRTGCFSMKASAILQQSSRLFQHLCSWGEEGRARLLLPVPSLAYGSGKAT